VELTHLRYFYNVAKTRSFVNGARLSFVTPPAMSKAVKKLEDELGTPLLVRTTRAVALTQSGEILFEHCHLLFDCVDAMQRALEKAQALVAGPLRVGAMEVFSIYLLPVALCGLVERHPDVVPSCFEMLPQVMERMVLGGELDVGFTIGGGGARGIDYRTVGTSRGVLVCGPQHALYEAGKIRKGDLSRHPFVVPRFFGRDHLPVIDQFPEDRHPRQVGATIELLQMGVRMVASGTYLGYFPEVTVWQLLDDGSLRELRGISLGPPFELCALTRTGIPPKAATELLIEQVEQLVSA
jgi:DNA-binding transcriptional LysR family regulator